MFVVNRVLGMEFVKSWDRVYRSEIPSIEVGSKALSGCGWDLYVVGLVGSLIYVHGALAYRDETVSLQGDLYAELRLVETDFLIIDMIRWS